MNISENAQIIYFLGPEADIHKMFNCMPKRCYFWTFSDMFYFLYSKNIGVEYELWIYKGLPDCITIPVWISLLYKDLKIWATMEYNPGQNLNWKRLFVYFKEFEVEWNGLRQFAIWGGKLVFFFFNAMDSVNFLVFYYLKTLVFSFWPIRTWL